MQLWDLVAIGGRKRLHYRSDKSATRKMVFARATNAFPPDRACCTAAAYSAQVLSCARGAVILPRVGSFVGPGEVLLNSNNSDLSCYYSTRVLIVVGTCFCCFSRDWWHGISVTCPLLYGDCHYLGCMGTIYLARPVSQYVLYVCASSSTSCRFFVIAPLHAGCAVLCPLELPL